MVIEARLENESAAKDGRGVPRRKLRLSTPGTTDAGHAASVVVHDISESGLLLQTSARLKIGEQIEVVLPHAGPAAAKVIWKSGELRGCQFEKRLSKASISAAQLQSQPLGFAAPSDERPSNTGVPDREESFGARLRRLRRERKISLIGFARRLGVSKPTVWKWERNEVRPRRKAIEAAAATLGVTEQELVFGGREPKPQPFDNAQQPGRQLGEVIAACKAWIGNAAGTSAANISVTIRM